jgi:glutamine synthetase
MATDIAAWIKDRGIAEVECIIPDMNGIQRGKVLPAGKFLSSITNRTLRIPGSVFTVTAIRKISATWSPPPIRTW